MDKKTVKVIEKYSMPFVQLVIEKEKKTKSFLTWIKSSKSLKKQVYLLF